MYPHQKVPWHVRVSVLGSKLRLASPVMSNQLNPNRSEKEVSCQLLECAHILRGHRIDCVEARHVLPLKSGETRFLSCD